MFLFESSKEKEVRLGVEKNMEICISNPKKYNQAKEALVAHIRGSDQKVIEMIVDNVKATIKNQDLQPIRKYQAILLLKDLMLTYNKALGKYVVKKILKRLTILAQHRSGNNEDRDEDKGKDIFGSVKRDQETYAVQFLNTLLTALEEWGKNWPKAPDGPNKDFQRQYNELLMNGVHFPKQRPKEATKSPIKNSREEIKTPESIKQPSVSPNRPSIEKPKARIERKDTLKRSSLGSNAELKLQLSQFYQKIASSFLFLQQILQGGSLDQLQAIKDSIAQIEKEISKGNEYVITMQDFDECENDQIKIESMFSFMEKIQKDLKVVDKKPQQFAVFQNKYLKLTKRTLEILNNKGTGKKEKGASADKMQNAFSTKTEDKSVSKLDLQKKQEPKIKQQNRYVSVTGEQVLEQFNKVGKLNQFQSHSGNSVNSDRFGSFGGLPGVTERPKTLVALSPANTQFKKKAESKSQRYKQSPETNPKPESMNGNSELPIQSMPQTGVKKSLESQSQQIISMNRPGQRGDAPRKEIEVSHNFFDQFQKQQPKSSIEAHKERRPSDSNQFGGQNFPKNQANSSEDFFGNIENQAQGNDMSKVSRRKIHAETPDDPQNIFSNVPSKINSEALSAFSFPTPASQSVINAGSSKKVNEDKSKKEMAGDNPFNIQTFRPGSQTSEHNASNFFDQFEKKPENDPLKRSNQSNFFGDEKIWEKRQSGTNPFETGNFGKYKEKQGQNDGEAGSVKSKKSIKSFQNPFQNDSFSGKSKNSQASKGSIGRSNFPNDTAANNPFAQSTVKDNNNNPFSSRAGPLDNPFSQPAAQDLNPFETSSHPSNKNPFDQVQQMFKPAAGMSIEDVHTKRNSLENTRRKNVEQVRDSLVLAVNMNQQPEQGLNFSQFPDIGANDAGQKQNPFKSGSEKSVSKHEQSGFSLSNFPGIGQQPANLFQNQSSDKNIEDFFSQFEKPSIISKGSKKQLGKAGIKQSGKFFEDFNVSVLQKQKTIYSRHQKSKKDSNSQKSFNFENLDNLSVNQKQLHKNSIAFDDFLNMSKDYAAVKSQKQNVYIDNKQQKSLSWGDFDQNNKRPSSEHQDQPESKLNEIPVSQSKHIVIPQLDKEQVDPNKDQTQKQASSSLLSLADFTPLAKKGVDWNPLLKLKNAKSAQFYYNVDDKKVGIKKAELQAIEKRYKQKVTIFKSAKLKNEEVRGRLLQKMKKLDVVIHQKEEFQQMLKKLQETNDIKEKQISQIHSRIKRTEDLKNKILMKERKLFQITKLQINKQEKKSVPHRTMASKWEMFNKHLDKQRAVAYTSVSRFSQG